MSDDHYYHSPFPSGDANARNRSELTLAIKCGGHHYSSANSIEDGLQIDLGALKDISIDKVNKTVMIGGGCVWGEVYTALRDENRVCIGGGVHVVGVGGHLTGGKTLYVLCAGRVVADTVKHRRLWSTLVQIWDGSVICRRLASAEVDTDDYFQHAIMLLN